MKRFMLLTALLGLLYMNVSIADTKMTNADVIKLVKAGVATDIVLAAIQGSEKTSFDVSTDNLIELKTAGIADAIIQAMIVAMSDPATLLPETLHNKVLSGTIKSSVVPAEGTLTAIFQQDGNILGGAFSNVNVAEACFSAGEFSGEIEGDQVFIKVVSSDGTVHLSGIVSSSGISGSYEIKTGRCAGDKGTLELDYEN